MPVSQRMIAWAAVVLTGFGVALAPCVASAAISASLLRSEPASASVFIARVQRFHAEPARSDSELLVAAVNRGRAVDYGRLTTAEFESVQARKSGCIDTAPGVDSAFWKALRGNIPFADIGPRKLFDHPCLVPATPTSNWTEVVFNPLGFQSIVSVRSHAPGVGVAQDQLLSCSGVIVRNTSRPPDQSAHYVLTARHCLCGYGPNGSMDNNPACGDRPVKQICGRGTDRSCRTIQICTAPASTGQTCDGLVASDAWVGPRSQCRVVNGFKKCVDIAAIKLTRDRRVPDYEIAQSGPANFADGATIAGYGIHELSAESDTRDVLSVGWIAAARLTALGASHSPRSADQSEPATKPCQGDSGGPVFSQMSFGFECCQTAADCKTNISSGCSRGVRRRKLVGLLAAIDRRASRQSPLQMCQRASVAAITWFADPGVKAFLSALGVAR